MALTRFDPKYWAVNFGTTCAASVVAPTSSSLLVTCNFRMVNDLIALYWYSTDTYSHTQYTYATNNDYSTATLDFDFVLSANMRALDQVNGPTLTVNHVSGGPDFVRLSNYVTSGTNQAGHITLSFATVKGGFSATTPIDWTAVTSLEFSLVTTVYDPANSAAMSPPLVGTVQFNNITVTGPTLAQNFTAFPAHNLRVTDGYDDSYPQTPTRLIQQLHQLGYRSWYSIYMGISHYHDLIWDAGESRLVVNPSSIIVNDAAVAWFSSLLSECLTYGFTNVVISVSYEIVDYLMPDGWPQLDYQGNPGLSGWTPPSEFISPSNTTALSYLADVVKIIFSLFPGGVNQVVQIGEPWWWDNSFSNNAPCFYDSATVAAYTAQTGLPVPTPYITSNTFTITAPYTAFVNWLSVQLGASTHYIANAVTAVYTSAQQALLFYTPQIFESALMKAVNLPVSWNFPAWDILQVEDYQWILDADWIDHATTWTTAEVTMGYPLDQIHYFSGFNLLTSTADSVWPNVITAILDGFSQGVAQVWVWARPELFRDGILYPPLAWTAYDDPLLISINQSYAGFNYKDNRSVWYDLTNVTLGSGGFGGSVWFQDGGPVGMASDELEARAFCLQGNATMTFTGTTFIVRLNVAFSWFTGATVKIDGVSPSTLGLLTAVDTLSCDSASYGLTNDDYIDVIVADGLTDTSHTCVITIDSTNPAKFFSLSGYKVGSLNMQAIERDGTWLVDSALAQNTNTLTLLNRSATKTVVNTSLTFAPSMGIAPLTATSLAPGQFVTQSIVPNFTGFEVSGTFPLPMTLIADYVDPQGTLIGSPTTVTALVGNGAYVVTGTWFTDTVTPTLQERIYTTVFGTAYIQLTFSGDSLSVTVEATTGWGTLGLYAADNSTLLFSIPCNTTAGTLITTTYTGFGAGTHVVYFKKVTNDGLYVVLVAAAWSVTFTYTQILEYPPLNYVAQQPYALRLEGVEVTAPGTVRFTPPTIGALDYSGVPVRANTFLAYSETLTRFPTFAVCYKAGFFDVLSQYDILIVDPLAAHAADVIAWQALGIKVYGYISSGEETGVYSNRYDFTSALGPWQGAGPGGSSTYYMYTQDPTGPPDQDGVFAAFYTNPDPAFGWPAKIESYYAPQVLLGPTTVVGEVVATKTVTITAGSVIVFDTAQSPIDADQTITLTTLDGSHTYVTYADYTFDVKTGAFVLNTGITPAVTSGQLLKISYTRKGHFMDGVFFDTVDTPDVYGGSISPFPFVSGYATNFAALINNFKAAHSKAAIISNRGFTILDNIISACDGVMFETWLTTPVDPSDITSNLYEIITDGPTITANNGFNAQLSTLRATHNFNVFSLNYCAPDSSGDTLRLYCRQQDATKGYFSWQSTRTLSVPAPNNIIPTPGYPITTNDFTSRRTGPV